MQKLRIPHVDRAPKLADFLEGVPREAELVVTDFRQYTPGDGVPVSQPTTAYLSYDDKNLYIAYVCKDAPELIRARLAKHDQIMADDRVTINIDTFHDHRHMYWFDINPYGVQADGNVTDGVEDDPSWDTLWRSEGTITKDGYTVLGAIPFKSLRFPSAEDQTWGLILGRLIQRNNEFSVWPNMSNGKPGWVQQGGDLEGLRELSAGRNVQLIPYGLVSRARYLDSPAGGAERLAVDSDARAGLDGKIVLKDAFTLDVALNPDFSQVESDEPQVTINQRYEVYYPEKRPFFLENAGFFRTPERLFFSRRIIDPTFGARLTGKVGKWSMGGFFIDDKARGANRPSDDPLSGDHGLAAVARVQREFGGRSHRSSAGAMFTSDDFGSSYNRVYSVDAKLQLLPNWLLSGQAMASNTRLLDGTRLAGPAYYAQFVHQGRHFISETRYTDHSPTFRADLGYFQRLDIREASQTTGYMWRPEGGPVQRLGPVFYATLNYNREGRIRDWQVCPEFQLGMTRETQITVQRIETFEMYGGSGFRRHSSAVGFRSVWLRWLTVDGSYGRGTAINYNPAAGRTAFLGGMTQANAGVVLRAVPHLETEERYIYNGLHSNGTASIFSNHILRSKMNYQFTRDLSLRFIADYNSVLPNTALTSLQKDKRVGLDLLFTYMLNPGTALYAGYTDLYQNYRLDPTLSPALYRTSGPDLNTGRQIFIKISYLLRF